MKVPLTVRDHLDRALAVYPDRTAFVDEPDQPAPSMGEVTFARMGELVDAAGAGLDVTEPEPLPDDSGLWVLPNCVITPHIGNTREMGLPLITNRVRENVRRWLAGEELLGRVDVALGY